MLSGGLAAVHPAPRRALKRVVKGRERDEGLRDAAVVGDNAHAVGGGAGKKSENGAASEDEDDPEDSDYNYDEDADAADELDADEEEDSVEHRLALQAELDECSDEGRQDFYLQRMLAARGRLEGDEAAWVDRYIELQQQWKDRHAYSIDDFDLDVRLRSRMKSSKKAKAATATTKRKESTSATGSKIRRPTKLRKKKRKRREYSRVARAFWRFWYLRVAPKLPLELQEERAEYVVALIALLAFVGVSVAIQVIVVLGDS